MAAGQVIRECGKACRRRFHVEAALPPDEQCRELMRGVPAVLLALALLAFSTAIARSQTWVAQGPAPNTRGQVENIKNGEVVGAINAVAVHPTNAEVVYVGAVNGGIWKTANAMAASPLWTPLTDGHKSLSIGALEFDPTDAKSATLLAGLGRFSSIGDGGARRGLLRTTDGGKTWTAIEGKGALVGLNIAGVAPRGEVLVVAANASESPGNEGVWRSTDTGATWKKISGGKGTGLPAGRAFDLAGDPADAKRLFANGGSTGLYRSDDTGATWKKVSDQAMDALIADAGNVEIAVGRHDNVFVAIVVSGELAGVFRSGNNGATWVAMDLPATSEGGIHPGGQGRIHLSIAADPGNGQLVYIGGDRQDRPFPNSIGARDYSGRLFRGDASKKPGTQWAHLTHSSQLGAAGGGTAGGSAPHADSRDMKVAADGTLIEVDDGGIYRRTLPQTNQGDWFSMNGNLQTAEFHSVAWDSIAHIVVGGAQDTGTPQQQAPSGKEWQSVSTADGGVVAVDVLGSPGLSTRYSSSQRLFGFRRRVYDAANVFQGQVFPSLAVLNGGSPLQAQFYTPIKANAVAADRLIVGGANSVYESLDQGDTISEIGPTIAVNAFAGNPIAYGAGKNPDALYVGSGVRVFIRMEASPAPLVNSGTYPGGFVWGVAVHPNDAQSAFVIDSKQVYRTADAGGTWANVSGNLPTLAGRLRSVAYAATDAQGLLAVGTDAGVFAAPGPSFLKWSALGTGLPAAPVSHLEYNAADDILLAGTLGRGSWTLSMALPPGPPAKKAKQKMTTFILRPGAVVDRQRGQLYLMSPAGGVDAVRLDDGKLSWTTKEAAKPLRVIGDQLVAQADGPPKKGNALTVVVLGPETGVKVTASAVDLPPGVRPLIDQTAKSEFLMEAAASNGDAIVAWRYAEHPNRGVPPGVEEKLELKGDKPTDPGPPAAPAAPKVKSGGFKIELETGKVFPLDGKEGPPIPVGAKAAEVPKAERIEGAAGVQLLSADGQHILVSKRAGDDRAWEKYTLTVYERGTRKALGEFRSHLASMPFFVADSKVIFEAGPYTRRVAGALVNEPLKIRAVDLRTSAEVWAKEIRDTVYRGPLPP